DPLSRFGFHDCDVANHPMVASNGVHGSDDEACCLKKRFPFALVAFFTAGHSEHVEVAHQEGFQLWICMGDERRKDEFNDQQTAVLRNDGAAVLENGEGICVLTAVQHMGRAHV